MQHPSLRVRPAFVVAILGSLAVLLLSGTSHARRVDMKPGSISKGECSLLGGTVYDDVSTGNNVCCVEGTGDRLICQECGDCTTPDIEMIPKIETTPKTATPKTTLTPQPNPTPGTVKPAAPKPAN